MARSRFDVDDPIVPRHEHWLVPCCLASDVRLLESAYREAIEALNRACRHDDPDNSGLCIKCGVVVDYDGPMTPSQLGFTWESWAKERRA